jgi:glycosyltransferase involved in cell wall biosynthesis
VWHRTFSADLRAAIRQADPAVEVDVVSIVADQPAADRRACRAANGCRSTGIQAEVTRHLQQAVPHDYAAVAEELNRNGTDVVLIEHEFGIFGGEAGEYVLALAAELEVPMVVTLHTVLSNPSEQQAATLRRLCEAAALVTVFTETASRMVVGAGIVSADRVRLVPHGAPPLIVARELAPTADGSRAAAYAATAGHGPALVGGTDLTLRRLRGRRVLSSFGLISSGKGLETAIRAVEHVVDRHPDVLYLIAGQTHPEVAKREGESYRQVLENLVGELGLQQHVHFLDRFLTIDELALLLSSTDLYLTPYRSREQIVSGALTFAVAAGCPVVSTPYLYAEDLLSTGAGVLVPFDDPAAMAGAVNALLDDPAALDAARAESSRIGAGLSWNSVAAQTVQVLREVVRRPAQPAQPNSVEHAELLSLRPDQLLALTDDVGIIQHADGVTPRYDSGYCIDDAARLVLVGLGLDGGFRSGARSGWFAAGWPCSPTASTPGCRACTTSWPTTADGWTARTRAIMSDGRLGHSVRSSGPARRRVRIDRACGSWRRWHRCSAGPPVRGRSPSRCSAWSVRHRTSCRPP